MRYLAPAFPDDHPATAVTLDHRGAPAFPSAPFPRSGPSRGTRHRRGRAVRLGLLVAVVVMATLSAGCGGDGGGGSGDAAITLHVVDGELVGGPRTEDVPLGATVHMEVTGNTDGEVHIHGYDEHIELADGAGSVDFTADIPGTFEVELEGSGALLVRMTVS